MHLVMTVVGIALLLSIDKIVRLKVGTTVIAGITTALSAVVMLSPFIDELVSDRPEVSSGVPVFIVIMFYNVYLWILFTICEKKTTVSSTVKRTELLNGVHLVYKDTELGRFAARRQLPQ